MKAKKAAEQSGQPADVRWMVRRVCISGEEERDYRGEKNYRTVYAIGELDRLYVDTEIVGLHPGDTSREIQVGIYLLYQDTGKVKCIAEKQRTLRIPGDDPLVMFGESFGKDDLADKGWKEGRYCVVAEIDGRREESDTLFLLQGNGQPADYFRLMQVGIDRCCEESETEAQARPHSFRELNAEGLKNVRFFLIAQNLCGEEWLYEFICRVVGEDGRIKSLRLIRDTHYIQDQAGNSLLCFMIDLGEEGTWNRTEDYTLFVSCWGKNVLKVDFRIGDKDVPYDFSREMLAVAEVPGETFLPDLLADPVAAKEEIMDRLYKLVGLRKVKEEMTRLADYAGFVRLRRKNGLEDRQPVMHLIFTGHPGTGKNTVAEMVGELYCKLGFLQHGKVNHYSRADLLPEGTATGEPLLVQALQHSLGGILFIDRAGELFHPEDPEDRGMVVLSALCRLLSREQPQLMVILADEEEVMEMMVEAMPELQKLFPRRLCFEDYTPEELMEITRKKLEKLQYHFTPGAEEKFYKQLRQACMAHEVDFTNGRYIDEQIEAAAVRMSRRLMSGRKEEYCREELMLLTEEDIETAEIIDPGEPMEKLRAMVGLEQLKQSLDHHLNYVYFIRERQRHGFADVMPPLNMVFCGNPGTGKATVARMLGEIYYAAGILSRPNVVVQDALRLTSDAGMSPQEGAEMLVDRAIGGILYLAHAEVLPRTEFGLALFEALLTYLSVEECGDTLVILSGYPDNMQKMLEVNPALRAYFPYVFRFNDYTPEELMQIAEGKLKEKEYVFHPKAREAFEEVIRKIYENRNKNFGNVLLVEKITALSIRNMSERTMKIRRERELTRQEMTTLRKEDIPVDLFDPSAFGRDLFDEQEIKAALHELEQMVGQEGIKKQIRDFVELARHYSREGIKLSSRMSLQWCFTGNSAMGKGTVARIIARLYKAMGIVSQGQVIDFKVERLLGMTEEEARHSIGEALARSKGGILLFDEDSPKLNEVAGVRDRVKALLLNQMAEGPGSCILIYAQPRERVAGINGEAEHMSEVVNILNFEDYSPEQLMDILKRRLAKENMKLTASARRYLADFIASLVSTEERSRSSSRLMRIIGDMIVRNCLQRMARKQISVTTGNCSVQKQDVVMFTEQFVAGLMKERKRIGFV